MQPVYYTLSCLTFSTPSPLDANVPLQQILQNGVENLTMAQRVGSSAGQEIMANQVSAIRKDSTNSDSECALNYIRGDSFRMHTELHKR